jgi:hypothetical protein
MSVQDAVARAMRSGRVIVPSEFPAIHREALATIDLSQMGSSGYLLRGEAVEALRGAHFRNEAEQRTFYVSFIGQARDRVLTQLQSRLSAMPAADRASQLACFDVTAPATFAPAACFVSGAAGYAFQSGRQAVDGRVGFSSGLLRYLGEALPAEAFIGLPGGASSFSEIQLLDGVQFTTENFRDASLPAETRISASAIRMIYRVNLCTEGSTLPDCR